MITLSNDTASWMGKGQLAAASMLARFLVGLTLWMAIPINRLFGRTGINVITRVMAVIVAAIGVNFMMTGIKSELPGLVTRSSVK